MKSNLAITPIVEPESESISSWPPSTCASCSPAPLHHPEANEELLSHSHTFTDLNAFTHLSYQMEIHEQVEQTWSK
ncbi:hypothetical protein E2C01_058595 [Portunus trituberculatus]|uniref:Uncharacterized protein n=1 Tax=Portunus trituberculatus TaxID=210409 RepID=A0A5B7H5U4_PORTR|nr:hypothetical protein [Portunus trituberculatus]